MSKYGGKSGGPLSEILLLGSGVIIFLPLLLIFVAALTELAPFR